MATTNYTIKDLLDELMALSTLNSQSQGWGSADVILLIGQIVYVMEYKVGEVDILCNRQVMDYCLDLKNFHATSHDRFIVSVLIASEAEGGYLDLVQFRGGTESFEY